MAIALDGEVLKKAQKSKSVARCTDLSTSRLVGGVFNSRAGGEVGLGYVGIASLLARIVHRSDLAPASHHQSSHSI